MVERITAVTTPVVSNRPGESSILIVRNDAGRVVWILSNASSPVWARNASGFAFTGNLCAGWNQMWFDTRSGDLISLTGGGVHSSVAGPGLGQETLAVLRARADVWWMVEELDIDSLKRKELFVVDAGGSFNIIGWNPTGTRLLVMHTGRGKSHLCQRSPTAVERVAE